MAWMEVRAGSPFGDTSWAHEKVVVRRLCTRPVGSTPAAMVGAVEVAQIWTVWRAVGDEGPVRWGG